MSYYGQFNTGSMLLEIPKIAARGEFMLIYFVC